MTELKKRQRVPNGWGWECELRTVPRFCRYELLGGPDGHAAVVGANYRKDMPTPFGKLTATGSEETSRRTRMTEVSGHDWKHLAEAARDEHDPKKLMNLIDRLNRALEEHVKGLYPRAGKAAN